MAIVEYGRPRRQAAALLLLSTVLSSSAAAAPDDDGPSGAADFRTAPTVGDGTYRDTLLTGESVWFKVYYENDADVTVDATLLDGSETETLALTTDIVGPTLQSFDDRDSFSGFYGSGDTINTWFVRVNLRTDGPLGIEYEYELALSGFTDPPTRQTETDDSLRQEVSELQTEIDQLNVDIAELGSQPTGELAEDVASDIVALEEERAQLLLEKDQADRRVPPWAWFLGVLLAVGGLALPSLAFIRGRRAASVSPVSGGLNRSVPSSGDRLADDPGESQLNSASADREE